MESTIFRDLDQERTLLKYLSTVDATGTAFIRPEWFAGEIESVIFKVLRERKTVIPYKTLKAEILKELPDQQHGILDDTLDEIYECEDVKTEKASEVIAGQLRDLYYQREIIQLSEIAGEHAAQGDLTAAFQALRSANILVAEGQGIESGDYLEDFESRLVAIKDRQVDTKKTGLIPTGVMALDTHTGGILRGEVGVVIAATGMGKSASKLNIATCAWLNGYNVIYFGLEMDKAENQFRVDSLLTEIPATYFRRASITTRDFTYWKTVIDNFRKTRSNYFEFVSGKGVTMDDALSLVEGVENRKGKKVDLFILDYIGLIDSGVSRDGRDHVHKGRDFNKLLDFAGKGKRAVWTSSQTTDEGATRKEGMRTIDVKYSRAIAEGAHLILALWQNDMDVQARMLNCRIIKGRGVEKGQKIILRPDFNRMVLDIPSWADVIKKTIKKLPDRPKRRSVFSLDTVSADEVLKQMGNIKGDEDNE